MAERLSDCLTRPPLSLASKEGDSVDRLSTGRPFLRIAFAQDAALGGVHKC
jgi:hypothetical protein